MPSQGPLKELPEGPKKETDESESRLSKEKSVANDYVNDLIERASAGQTDEEEEEDV